MPDNPFSPKQLEFIFNGTKKWNIAHGSVRSGKTICTLFAFLHAVDQCKDSDIYMVGYSMDTIYRNAVRLILESPQFALFRPFCTWSPGKRELKYKNKTIKTLGAQNEGAIGQFQGNTWSLGYCDEMTLYPDSIIDMIDTRLSKQSSKGFASMNPSHPEHKIKKWIDRAEEGDKNYYSCHFTLDDNPYVPQDYKDRISQSLSGVFYKRNYLGLWCLAEGAIFDFFDRSVHVLPRPPRAAEYWVAGIDYGTTNNFSCILMGVNTGYDTQLGPMKWFEKEYVWNSHEKGRQKTNFEYVQDVEKFLEPYAIKHVYVDPSAASFKLELRKKGFAVIDAVNDVTDGINQMTSEMKKGSLFVCEDCKVLIKEIQGYCWDPAAAKKGLDKPIKKNDHCFVAGTQVLTLSGPKNIEEIKEGEYVKTRSGWNKVLNTFEREAEVSTYSILGKDITCTPTHRFQTLSGWKQAQHLIQSDMFYVNIEDLWKEKKLHSTEFVTNDIPMLKELAIDDISELLEDVDRENMDISIEMFGNTTMEKLQREIMYIIVTGIHPTTTLAISNVSHLENIIPYINQILHKSKKKLENVIATELDLLQKNGIEAMKVENGIHNREKSVGKNEKAVITNANSVVCHLKQKVLEQANFVRINVKANGEEILELITRVENVFPVEQTLKPINIAKSNPVLENVVSKYQGIRKVFNLHVENENEYYVENILVHNCIDASRYASVTHKVAPYQPYKHNPFAYQQNRFMQ